MKQDTYFSEKSLIIMDNCYLVAIDKENIYNILLNHLIQDTLNIFENYLQDNNIDYPKNIRLKPKKFNIMQVYGRILDFETKFKDIENFKYLEEKFKTAKNQLINTYLQLKYIVGKLAKN